MRTLLQNDTSDFGHESLYRVQTIINNVSLITDDIWSTLNRMIVDHGLEVFGVASDAPLEARTDSYVVETHVETPHDVRLLRDSIILAMQLGLGRPLIWGRRTLQDPTASVKAFD